MSVLEDHGPGVYAVVMWALLNGRPEVISGYAIFQEVEVRELCD